MVGTQSTLTIPGITDPSKLACIARARKYKQYCRMVEDALAGRCPFCTIDPKYNKIVLENAYWMAWDCKPPEKYTKHHVLIVPKTIDGCRHITDLGQLNQNQRFALFEILAAVKDEYGITSCGIQIRDGDATMSAGTIEHLHAHVMVPDGTGRLESPFYKGDEAEAKSLAKAIIFEKIRSGIAKLDDLPADEKALVEGLMD